MLTRICADNLFCFVDFAFTPGKFTVLAGQPGSGRSKLFFLIDRLEGFLLPGRKDWGIWDDFSRDLRTAWQDEPTQAFAVEFDIDQERYTYRLTVAHGDDYDDARLVSEEVLCNEQPLFTCVDGFGRLHDDDQSFSKLFTSDGTKAMVAKAAANTKNVRLQRFSEWWLRRLYIGLPGTDETFGMCEEWRVWYHQAAESDPQRIVAFEQDLRRVLPRFVRVAPSDTGRAGIAPIFKHPHDVTPSESEGYSFEYLSTRERVLIQLYALAHLAMQPGHTLCIDSPQTNLATPVLRDWLQCLMRRADETSTQVLVVVDDPDVIAELPAGVVQRFERPDNGAVVVTTKE